MTITQLARIISHKFFEHVPTDQLRQNQCNNYDDYRFCVQEHPDNRNGGCIIACKMLLEELLPKNMGNANLVTLNCIEPIQYNGLSKINYGKCLTIMHLSLLFNRKLVMHLTL